MKTSRRKRVIRDKANPPGMRLTVRDQEILRWVSACRLLTTEQICQLLFSPSTRSICARRLRLLFHNEYLDRFPLLPGVPTGKLAYRLTKKGAQTIGAKQGRKDKEISYFTLQHAQEINAVRVAIVRAAREKGFVIEKWLDDLTLRSDEMKEYVRVDGKKVAVVPDAYFVLVTPRRAHFFLELDRGTEDNKRRWRAKIQAYEAYTRPEILTPSRYRQKYQTDSLRILTVTISPQRVANMLKVTETETKGSFYWFAARDQVLKENVLTAPIWLQSHGEKAPRPLLALSS